MKRTLCFSNPAYLSLKNGQLEVRFPEFAGDKYLPESLKQKANVSIPIEDIGIVVLDHQQITITQALMEQLLNNSCSIITCNGSHLPIGLLLPLCGNTTQNERFRCQIEASRPLQKQLWQQTIKQKISNQASLLRTTRQVETGNMMQWVSQVKSNDSDNLEARAAAYYWLQMFPDIPHFVRGRDELPPNNLLNYGYAIVRAVIARALVVSGLLPTLGIHHHNRYNAYCLADDIMEPYRPYVDLLVVEMVGHEPPPPELTPEHKRRLLSLPTTEVLINGHRSPLMVAASQTTASLYKCFAGESRRILYPEL